MHLYQRLAQKVAEWRAQGYPHAQYPAIAEILEYATLPESTSLRLLRRAQLRALETYWYLRLVEGTPHIFDLYRKYYPGMQILTSLGLDTEPIKDWLMQEMFSGGSIDTLWEHIRGDAEFVKQHDLESVHETLALDYPSYILALAMGAGKTMLIGAIVATEFAMALEYPGDECPFIQNALAFAPGLTILESLRELAEVRYDKLLPPRLYTPFEATYKLVFTREGEKDLPIIWGSRYNLVVTNTEKIRIQKTIRQHPTWTQFEFEQRVEQAEAEANIRLQAIASLPNLGVFSDEAHHTYGRDVGKDLKRVRQTVDYLHQNTDVVCVVNTTGTPYYERQPLRDVVLWYGLSEGIRDNILKSVDNSIYAYDFDNQQADQFVAEVVRDFFTTYGDVRLPNGAPAKLALYFPQTKDLRELRPVVEQVLLSMGYSTDIVLRNTSESTDAEIDAFNRLNNPASPHRVILLVNKGTEGWNCPSLFACALARKLRTSQNFVLQAGTRCLRQIPGNPHKARIYLSSDNQGALDRQLQETYGETIAELSRAGGDVRTARIIVRKVDIPPLVVKKFIRRVVPSRHKEPLFLHLDRPTAPVETTLIRRIFTLAERADAASVMLQRDESAVYAIGDATRAVVGLDCYTAAADLAAVYRLDAMTVYRELRRLYPTDAIVPETHLPNLRRQIEDQTSAYAIEEEEVEEALALLKLDGFNAESDGDAVNAEGTLIYTAEITYHKDKEALLLSWKAMLAQNPHSFGFHYDPYNFDSAHEKDYFSQVLDALNIAPDQVEDIYFTGALTDPRKTDFYIEYRGTDDRWHRYSPDFVIRRKDGKAYIVEIKAERERNHPDDGEQGRKALAVREWVNLNPERLKYEMIFTSGDSVSFNQISSVRQFIE